MKILTLTALFIISLALTPQSYASGQPEIAQPPQPLLNANPRAIMNAIDRDVADRWPDLIEAQQLQWQRHGRMMQLFDSHSYIPANGSADLPDQLWARPTYQSENWLSTNVISPLDGLPYTARVDAYEAPRGPGFVLVVQVVLEGQTYSRSWQYGPEQWRAHDWMILQGGDE
jgi:hypothetical protein